MRSSLKIALILSLVAVAPALAQSSLDSPSYRVKFSNFNMTSGSKSSDNYNILDTVGQTAAGEFDSSGFKVKAGFPYITTIIPFAFSISNLSLDFGTLTPQSFDTVSHTLTVSAGGAGGYTVTGGEDHPMRLGDTAIYIADTTCDTSCSETTADVWTNTAVYGFGYNMSGNDVPTAVGHFQGSTYFKQWADLSAAESPQTVMSSAVVGENRIATVTYKINISATQAAGDYQTQIRFVATPAY
jgi:hypothetical protein